MSERKMLNLLTPLLLYTVTAEKLKVPPVWDMSELKQKPEDTWGAFIMGMILEHL